MAEKENILVSRASVCLDERPASSCAALRSVMQGLAAMWEPGDVTVGRLLLNASPPPHSQMSTGSNMIACSLGGCLQDGFMGLVSARLSVDLKEEAVVRLGNALSTETTAATVDSCSVLQTKPAREERVGKGQRFTRRMEMSEGIPLQ